MKESLDLLKVEKNHAIWSFRNDKGIPLYLMIRFQILQSIIDRRFNLSNPHILPQLGFKDKLVYVLKALLNNPFRAQKKSVIIFSSGVVNSKSDNGLFYNRLYEYFLNTNPEKFSLIETSNKFCFNTPKQSRVFYRDSLDILVRMFSIFPLASKSEQQVAKGFIAYLKEAGVVDVDNYARPLIRSLAKYKSGYYVYRFFLRVKKPKLIIVEDASYGGLSYLVKAAKDQGIQVVEYQHGYIGLNHPAYNLNSESLPEDINQFLPSYFLTHGDYWSKQCRLPAQKISVGYPDLINRLSGYLKKQRSPNSNIRIIFISGGTIPDRLVAFVKAFVELNPCFDIILRPHPSERPHMQQRYFGLLELKVQLDTEDLYKTLGEVDIIVGFEVSTVLYESIFFTDKIYLVDDDYANFYEPDSPFLRFDSPQSLTEQINAKKMLDISQDYFWAKDPEQRFNEFLESQLKDN
jgi:hypothetical protein